MTSTPKATSTPPEVVLVSNSGIRGLAIAWIFCLLLGAIATPALFFSLEAGDRPFLTAAVVGGITFVVFLFGLMVRPIALSRLTRSGDEIKLTTLSRPDQ
ncbi:MAG: hypothetical protein ACFB11_23305 [Paracoccaceae bacterium]